LNRPASESYLQSTLVSMMNCSGINKAVIASTPCTHKASFLAAPSAAF
jgi:hypothetical protein